MMNNEWDDYAGGWDSNASTSLYADKAYEALSNITLLDGLTVFDFGCGTGLLAERLSPQAKEIVALDGSSKMIGELKKKSLSNVFPISEFLSKNLIEKNTLLHKKFDLITASSVCAFVPDYEETLSFLKLLLRPNGMYVQWDWLASDEGMKEGFTERQVERGLLSAGFKHISTSQPFSMGYGDDNMPVLMAVAKAS